MTLTTRYLRFEHPEDVEPVSMPVYLTITLVIYGGELPTCGFTFFRFEF